MYDIEKDIKVMTDAIYEEELELNKECEKEYKESFPMLLTREEAERYAESAFNNSLGISALVEIEEKISDEIERLYSNYTKDEYTHGYIDALTMLQKCIPQERPDGMMVQAVKRILSQPNRS